MPSPLKLLAREDRRLLLVLVLCGLSVTISLFLIYRAIHQIYQTDGIEPKDIALGLLAVFFVSFGIYVEQITGERLAQRVVSRVRHKVFRKTLDSSASDDALHQRSSTFLRLTSDMSPIRNWVIHGLVNGIVLSIVLAGILALLLYIHPYLGLTALICFSALLLTSRFIGIGLSAASQEQRYQRTRMLDKVSTQLSALPSILMLNQKKRERRRYSKANQRLVDSTLKKAHHSGLMRAASESIMWFTFGALCLVGLVLVKEEQIAAHELIMIMTSSVFLLHRFRNIYQVVSSWASIKPSLLRLEQLLARKNRRTGNKQPDWSSATSVITIEHEGAQIDVLPDQVVYLEAHSQSGKQSANRELPYPLSLLDLNILSVGGVHPGGVKWTELTRSLSIVSVRFTLREAMVRSNLKYGYRTIQERSVVDLWEELYQHVYSIHPATDQSVQSLTEAESFLLALVIALAREPKVCIVDLSGMEEQRLVRRALDFFIARYSGATVCIYRPFQRNWFRSLGLVNAKHDLKTEGVSS